jgi:hypothetical protein
MMVGLGGLALRRSITDHVTKPFVLLPHSFSLLFFCRTTIRLRTSHPKRCNHQLPVKKNFTILRTQKLDGENGGAGHSRRIGDRAYLQL